MTIDTATLQAGALCLALLEAPIMSRSWTLQDDAPERRRCAGCWQVSRGCTCCVGRPGGGCPGPGLQGSTGGPRAALGSAPAPPACGARCGATAAPRSCVGAGLQDSLAGTSAQLLGQQGTDTPCRQLLWGPSVIAGCQHGQQVRKGAAHWRPRRREPEGMLWQWRMGDRKGGDSRPALLRLLPLRLAELPRAELPPRLLSCRVLMPSCTAAVALRQCVAGLAACSCDPGLADMLGAALPQTGAHVLEQVSAGDPLQALLQASCVLGWAPHLRVQRTRRTRTRHRSACGVSALELHQELFSAH